MLCCFFHRFFWVQPRSSSCGGGCFSGFVFFYLFVFVLQGLSFPPLYCWYAARGAVPSVFALASVVAGCVLSRCGVQALWGSRPMGGFDG